MLKPLKCRYRAASVGLAFAPLHRPGRLTARTGTIKRAVGGAPARLPRPDYLPPIDTALVLNGPWREPSRKSGVVLTLVPRAA